MSEPIIYKMVTQYDIVPTILEAKLDAHSIGEVTIEMKGSQVDIDMGMSYLKDLNIEIIEL